MIKKIFLFIFLIKLCLNTDCQDGTVCPGSQKCCATKDGTNCCPYSNGVCCSDMKHCCPSGYNCTSTGACIINSEIIIERDKYELPIIPIN